MPHERLYFDSCMRQIPRYTFKIDRLRAKLEMFLEELFICKNVKVRLLISKRIQQLRAEIKELEI